MLVLSRQRDETIMIGDAVEITILDIRGDKVRLGINAPPQIAVHRKEVYEAIKAENRVVAEANGQEPESTIRPGRSVTEQQNAAANGTSSSENSQKGPAAPDAAKGQQLDTDGPQFG